MPDGPLALAPGTFLCMVVCGLCDVFALLAEHYKTLEETKTKTIIILTKEKEKGNEGRGNSSPVIRRSMHLDPSRSITVKLVYVLQ